MNIQTKYDLGDTVWIMLENRAVKMKVMGVNTETHITTREGKTPETKVVIKAGIPSRQAHVLHEVYDDIVSIYEEYFYPSKEELLKTL